GRPARIEVGKLTQPRITRDLRGRLFRHLLDHLLAPRPDARSSAISTGGIGLPFCQMRRERNARGAGRSEEESNGFVNCAAADSALLAETFVKFGRSSA